MPAGCVSRYGMISRLCSLMRRHHSRVFSQASFPTWGTTIAPSRRRGVAIRVAVLVASFVLGLGSPPLSALAQVPGAPAPSGGALARDNECCLVLLLPVGANSVALGRTLTARSSQDGAFANPAGLAGLRDGYFMVHRTALAGDATAFSLLLTPRRFGTLGLSYQLLDFGEIETTDEGGMTIGTLSLRHHLLIASYATPIGGGLATGLNYKIYQFRVGCSGTCSEQGLKTSAHALDFGLRFAPRALPSLQLGAVISNFGFSPRADGANSTELLPLRLRLGAAYEVLEYLLPELPFSVWLSLELEDSARNLGSPTPSLGLELNADEMVFLRAGYIPGDGAGTGTAVGIGIHYARFVISVAKAFGTPFSEVDPEAVQVSFGIAF